MEKGARPASAVKEIHRLACGDAKDAGRGADGRGGAARGGAGACVYFASSDRSVDYMFSDRTFRGAEVEPADFLVVGGGDEEVRVVRGEDDGFDCGCVDATADFVACWC